MLELALLNKIFFAHRKGNIVKCLSLNITANMSPKNIERCTDTQLNGVINLSMNLCSLLSSL